VTPSLFLHLANLHRPRRNGRVADDADLRALAGFAEPVAAVTDGDAAADLYKLSQVASDLADAITAGRVPLPLGDLNAPARAALSFPQLVADPTRVAVTLEQSQLAIDPTAVLAARVAAELGAADLTRIRECARSECRLVFYDSTRSRTQRWHAEAPCGRLERQRRHRAREAASVEAAEQHVEHAS
jgi:predicted RNA-binding Zn ribbon-like protein